eukprot:m.262696 g.262696  ORF g.262696 m.262696 type:complete len:144 (-) comp25735_c0_seq1:31-462(-)
MEHAVQRTSYSSKCISRIMSAIAATERECRLPSEPYITLLRSIGGQLANTAAQQLTLAYNTVHDAYDRGAYDKLPSQQSDLEWFSRRQQDLPRAMLALSEVLDRCNEHWPTIFTTEVHQRAANELMTLKRSVDLVSQLRAFAL